MKMIQSVSKPNNLFFFFSFFPENASESEERQQRMTANVYVSAMNNSTKQTEFRAVID